MSSYVIVMGPWVGVTSIVFFFFFFFFFLTGNMLLEHDSNTLGQKSSGVYTGMWLLNGATEIFDP